MITTPSSNFLLDPPLIGELIGDFKFSKELDNNIQIENPAIGTQSGLITTWYWNKTAKPILGCFKLNILNVIKGCTVPELYFNFGAWGGFEYIYYRFMLASEKNKKYAWTLLSGVTKYGYNVTVKAYALSALNLKYNTKYIIQVGSTRLNKVNDKIQDLNNPKFILMNEFEFIIDPVSLTPTPTKNNISVLPTPTKSPYQTPTLTSALIILTPTPTASPRPTATLKPALIIPTPTPTPVKKSIDYNPQIISSCLFSTKKESISPFIDSQRLSYTLIHNKINKLSTLNEINSELLIKNGLAECKYIIKPVKLNSDSPASRLFISFAANVPNLTNIRLYYRVYNTIEDPNYTIYDQVWKFIGESGTRHTFSKTEFIDFEYEVDEIIYSGNTTLKEFDMFSIKIVLESEKDSIVPKIKDFRTIALS